MEMSSVLYKDFEYFDLCLETTKTDKQVIRADVKTYKHACSYITIKLFKRDNACDEYSLNQKLPLVLFALGRLSLSFESYREYISKHKKKETDSTTRKRTPKRTLKKNIALKKK